MSFPMPGQPDPDGTAHEEIRVIVSELENRIRKIGLYLEEVAIMSPSQETAFNAMQNAQSLKDAITSGDAEFVVIGTFAIGDVAWSKRVMDPEQDEIDDEARKMLPGPADDLVDKMRRAQEAGKSIFDLDDEEEEE